MKLRSLLVSLMLMVGVLGTPAFAQDIKSVSPYTATASLTTSTCAGATISSTGCIGVNLGGYKYVGVQLTGTWTGTVTFEMCVETACSALVTQNMLPSTGTQTAVTTATANGVWYSSLLVGSKFRVRFSTPTSGTVVVTVKATL